MEIGSLRPAVAGVTAPTPRAPGAPEQAVRTELPSPAAVSSVEDVDASSADRRGRPAPAPSDRAVSGEFVQDLRTKDLVFRWIDVSSGDVIRQYPDEAVLRVRAMMENWTTGPSTARTAVYDVRA